jgi:ureidoacrylate peracid hydrolase
MSDSPQSLDKSALLLCDLQNDFLHPNGAYGRAGLYSPDIAALPKRIASLADLFRCGGGWIVSTHFTLVPAKRGEPIIAPHLKKLRPFLRKGDFEPGAWGHALVDELGVADLCVEKIAYSAFYMTRLEWLLRKSGIEKLYIAGIVTNGGVSSTARDAHVRDFETVVLADGCGAFSREAHEMSLAALTSVAHVTTIDETIGRLNAS